LAVANGLYTIVRIAQKDPSINVQFARLPATLNGRAIRHCTGNPKTVMPGGRSFTRRCCWSLKLCIEVEGASVTTSMEITKAEIKRFLTGSNPAVLCITGEWGVGKTFLSRSVLDELKKTKGLGLSRYSYVSLFGLNSLDDMKLSLFENMEWLDQDATNFTGRGKAGVKAIAARAKNLSELAGALPYIGQFFSRARPLFFSLIQNQIVCIDDLERRSKNLDLKDVLGLMSFLREQRGCKVVLLFNADKLGEAKQEFDRLLEKVIETKVVLAPTAAESAGIALPEQDAISTEIRTHCEALDIRNIRIIKHIELLARRIDELLGKFPRIIRYQAVHSLTLFGWSKYDPDHAPNLQFLKISSVERHLRSRDGEAAPAPEAAWDALLEKYKFARADDFDLALMKYVDTLILDPEEIRNEAIALQEQQRLGELHGTFQAAWQAFHDSFADDEDNVVRQIVERTKAAYEVVSLANLNETILVLKALGRNDEARDLLQFFSNNRNDARYWNVADDPFARGPFDPDLTALIEQKKPAIPQDFDVAASLVSSAKNFDPETIARLAAVPVETYRDLILAARGDQLRTIVLSGLEFRRIGNASPEMKLVVGLIEEALRMIGRQSVLNALRLKKYGVSIEP
jgi:hypothetical protein